MTDLLHHVDLIKVAPFRFSSVFRVNILNIFDDFQDINLHFTEKKLQKQLAYAFYFWKKSNFLGLAFFHGNPRYNCFAHC